MGSAACGCPGGRWFRRCTRGGPRGAPGDDRGESRGDRASEHGGPRALRGDGDRVVANCGCDRGQGGCADGRADLAAGVDDASDDALLGACYSRCGDDHGAEGGAGRAEANQHDRGEQRTVMAAGRQLGQDSEACRGCHAREHQHASDSDAGSEPCPECARGEADDSLGRDRQPGRQRRVPEHLLEVQRQDQHLAAVPQAEEQVQDTGGAQRRPAHQRRGQQRIGVVPLGGEEGKCARRADSQGRRVDRRQPARHASVRHGEYQGRHRDRDQRRAAGIQPAPSCPAARVCEQKRRRGRGKDADRDVDQEHGAPARELYQDAAEHLAGDEADGGGRPVQAEGAGPLLAVGEACRDQRQCGRRDDRGTRALDDSRGNQQHGITREPAGQRGSREDEQSEDEHPAAPEHVRRPAAQYQQAAEGYRVAGDDPLNGRSRHPEFPPDGRESDIHDAEVQDDHERRHQDECEPQALMPGGRGDNCRAGSGGPRFCA